MRFWVVVTVFFSLIFPSSLKAASWNTVKGKHFVVYYQDDFYFADSVSTRAEEYYGKIYQDLGLAYSIKSNDYRFWLWEDRARIYIYNNAQDYRKFTAAPNWSGAVSNYKTREIFCYSGIKGFLDSVLPHEITHLLFREFVGFRNKEVPRWLDEGVAQFEENKTAEENVEDLKSTGMEYDSVISYIPIEILTRMDVNREDGYIANIFYNQSRLLVSFLINEYGSERFNHFCRELRDGKDLESAVRITYSIHNIKNIDDLNFKWKEWILERRKG